MLPVREAILGLRELERDLFVRPDNLEGGVAGAVARRVDDVEDVPLRPDDRRERPGLRGGRVSPDRLLVGEELRLAGDQRDGIGRGEDLDAELILEGAVSADVVLVEMGVDDPADRVGA